ncbi:MAG: TrkA family potassium uptake protein [Candidatus Dormibacteraeota bacterium]|nr:TrkA family potassium uptake protein [Candidatus Dormibacteraeota bacterium]
MKVVIVGCGRVGSTLARELDAAGHRVTIIDERVAAFSRLGEDYGGEMVVGTGIDESVLRRAGIEDADCFASVTNGDNRNIMAAQVAKVVFNVPRVITRIYDPIREQTYRGFGLETICSTRIVSDMVLAFLTTGDNPAYTSKPPAGAVPAR